MTTYVVKMNGSSGREHIFKDPRPLSRAFGRVIPDFGIRAARADVYWG